MNKKRLLNQLASELEALYQTALKAAKRAHNTATDKANIAENKYDTLGLEAAYLAEGQAKRASECQVELEVIQKLPAIDFLPNDAIAVGALVVLVDQFETQKYLFLAPVAGGHNFSYEGNSIVVITPSSPLGRALLGKYVDDEFELQVSHEQKSYLISETY